jgi:hypothetical protein
VSLPGGLCGPARVSPPGGLCGPRPPGLPGGAGRGGGRAPGGGLPGRVEQGGGEAVQDVGVDVPGHHRHDRGVAVITGGGPGAPGGLGGGGGQAAQLAQGHVQHDLGGLPGPAGQAARGDQPPAGLARYLHRDLCHIAPDSTSGDASAGLALRSRSGKAAVRPASERSRRVSTGPTGLHEPTLILRYTRRESDG